MASTLDVLIRNILPRVREINIVKILEPAIPMKFFGVHWSQACWDIPFKIKDKLLYCTKTKLAERPLHFLEGENSILGSADQST